MVPFCLVEFGLLLICKGLLVLSSNGAESYFSPNSYHVSS